MYLCSVTREGLGFWVIEKRIGFLPFWIYSEVERERERENTYKGFSFLVLFFIFLVDGVVN